MGLGQGLVAPDFGGSLLAPVPGEFWPLGSWPHRLTLVLLFYVGDVVSHFLECLDRITLFPRKTFAIGQMPQKHDDGISDLSKLLSIGADPVEDFGLGLRRA